MTGIVIRAYDAADDSALAAVDERIATEATRRPLLLRAHAVGGFWIAEADGKVAGYSDRTVEFFYKDFIALVVVDEDRRRRGIASALMRKVEDICAGDRIFTSTNESNAKMRALLAKLGYRPSGRIDNLDPADPELVFVKFLTR